MIRKNGIFIDGDRKMHNKLSALELAYLPAPLKTIYTLRQSILSIAAAAAGLIVVKEAKQRANPSIKNSIAMEVKSVGKTALAAIVGPRSRSEPYAHLFEFGTAPRFTKDGAARGQMPAQPFLRPALDNNKSAVKSAIRAKLRDGMLREAAKAERGGKL